MNWNLGIYHLVRIPWYYDTDTNMLGQWPLKCVWNHQFSMCNVLWQRCCIESIEASLIIILANASSGSCTVRFQFFVKPMLLRNIHHFVTTWMNQENYIHRFTHIVEWLSRAFLVSNVKFQLSTSLIGKSVCVIKFCDVHYLWIKAIINGNAKLKWSGSVIACNVKRHL